MLTGLDLAGRRRLGGRRPEAGRGRRRQGRPPAQGPPEEEERRNQCRQGCKQKNDHAGAAAVGTTHTGSILSLSSEELQSVRKKTLLNQEALSSESQF